MKKLFFACVLIFFSKICVGQNPQDCINAIKICTNTYVQNSSFSGYGTEQEVLPGGNTCLVNGETNSSWYSFRLKTSGTINFTIDPINPLDDYDFVLYNVTNATCTDISSGSLSSVRCNYSSTTGSTGLSSSSSTINSPSNGSPFCATLNVIAEETYMLMINNFTASAGGYTLNFTGSATIYDTEPPAFVISDAKPCSPTHVMLYFDELVEASSIAANGSDFIITGPQGVVVSSAVIYPTGNNPDPIRVNFASSIVTTGMYTITIQQGSDGNTISDYCGNFVPEGMSFSFQVTSLPPNPDIASITNANCLVPTGSATVVINGGVPPFTMGWNTVPPQSSLTATNLAPGTYVFSVLDANGCQASQSATIIVENMPEIVSTITPEVCYDSASGGAVVSVIGGVAPFTYLWNTIPPVTDSVATGLVAGTYTVQVTDATGCEINETIEVIQSEIPVIDITGTGLSCNGLIPGSLTASATGNGPFTYSWNTIPATIGPTMTSFTLGSYTCVVTDANGCTATSGSTITDGYMDLTPVTTDAGCPDSPEGTATVIAAGGTEPYSYLWNTNPPQTDSLLTGLAAGIYEVTVTDAGNCEATIEVIVEGPDPIVIDIITQEAGCSLSDGSALATAGGGQGPYIYQWLTSPPHNGALLNNIPAGVYQVLVIDNMGCTAENTAYISNFDGPHGYISASSDATCRLDNGSATVDIVNGNGPFSFLWLTTPPQPGATASNLPEGINVVRIEDANDCLSFLNVKINAIPMGYIYAGPVVNASCGFADGTATLLDSLSMPPLSYEWMTAPPQYTKTAVNLPAGNVWVYTTDGTGCRDSLRITVGENSAETNFTFDPGCKGEPTSFHGHSSYPGNITWIWSFGDSTSTGNNVGQDVSHEYPGSGTFPVTLYTVGGCATDTITKMVIAGIKPEAQFVADQETLLAETAVNFYYTGTPVVHYFWDFSDGSTSSQQSPAHNFTLSDSASVILIVEDIFGCRDTVMNVYEMDMAPAIYIPNSFTPNGDGINDYFGIPAHGLRNGTFRIFSRWGDVIYESDDIEQIMNRGWDGTIKGVESPQGSYVYKLSGNLVGGRQVEMTGVLTLVR